MVKTTDALASLTTWHAMNEQLGRGLIAKTFKLVFIPSFQPFLLSPNYYEVMKEVFNFRPAVSKAAVVWGAKILFDYFQILLNNGELNDVHRHKILFLLLLG